MAEDVTCVFVEDWEGECSVGRVVWHGEDVGGSCGVARICVATAGVSSSSSVARAAKAFVVCRVVCELVRCAMGSSVCGAVRRGWTSVHCWPGDPTLGDSCSVGTVTLGRGASGEC